jgi:hypothetical protein
VYWDSRIRWRTAGVKVRVGGESGLKRAQDERRGAISQQGPGAWRVAPRRLLVSQENDLE